MRTITIKSGQMGRFDNGSPFLVEEGALGLKFLLPQGSGEYFFVWQNAFEGGQRVGTLQIPKSGEISLADLLPGELRATVKHYLHGELIGQYKIEPLLLKEVEGSISATPELTEILYEIEAIKRALTDRDEAEEKRAAEEAERRATAAAEEEKRAAAQRAVLIRILAYAWALHESNLSLRDGTLKDFISALGLDAYNFSEDELGMIEKKKEEF